jgi:hypothetical protein
MNTNVATETKAALCERYAARMTELIETVCVSIVSAFSTKIAQLKALYITVITSAADTVW